MVFDMIEEIVDEYANGQNYEGFKLEMLRIFFLNIEMSEQEFQEKKPADMVEQMHQMLTDLYRRKSEQIAEMAYPVIKQVYESRGENFQNIAVPFTDEIGRAQVCTPVHNAQLV